MSEPPKSQHKKAAPSSNSSEEADRSTVKRLFSSVFSIIDSDREISHFDDYDQSSRIDRLLENSTFMSHIQNKLNSEGFFEGYKFPILRLSALSQVKLHGQPNRCQFDPSDVYVLASKFGQVAKVTLNREQTEAYFFFHAIANAYICWKLLRSMTLKASTREIAIQWVHDCGYHPDVASEVHRFMSTMNWQSFCDGNRREDDYQQAGTLSTKQNKFTCRYDIQIDNQREFQVARRIIGPKGCNMKRIIEEAVTPQLKASSDNLNELLKLRLRGRGSGYKEGPEQQESTESLHLCVSAKDENVYSQACQKVEKLLASIYSDYADFTRRQGRLVELIVKKVVLGQTASFSEDPNFAYAYGSRPDLKEQEEVPQIDDQYRISPRKIGELLELRNKARRQLNFNEADRIRNYLRGLGVCLIDQKGRRGKAADVTTWKYVY